MCGGEGPRRLPGPTTGGLTQTGDRASTEGLNGITESYRVKTASTDREAGLSRAGMLGVKPRGTTEPRCVSRSFSIRRPGRSSREGRASTSPRVRDAFRSAGVDADVELVEAAALQPAVRPPRRRLRRGGGRRRRRQRQLGGRRPRRHATCRSASCRSARLTTSPATWASRSTSTTPSAVLVDGQPARHRRGRSQRPRLRQQRVRSARTPTRRRPRDVTATGDQIPKWRAGASLRATCPRNAARSTSSSPSAGDHDPASRTSFLLVGNNRYDTGVRGFGRRARLDDGVLSLYVAHGGRRRTPPSRSSDSSPGTPRPTDASRLPS